jgi:TolA-binding protein
MDGANWAAIIVAFVSVISALLSGRAAQKAAQSSSKASISNARTQAETEAYNRARKMDIETIGRQDEEIEELRVEIRNLKLENQRLRRRITHLERLTGESSEQSTTRE